MERVKKLRSVCRGAFTKSANDLQQMLDSGSERELLDSGYELSLKKAEELFKVDSALKELMLDSADITEEEILAEGEKSDQYEIRWLQLKSRYIKNIEIKYDDETCSNYSKNTVQNKYFGPKRNFKLPKIELRKFDAQIKNWLSFWGQFKKIHEDESIDDDDKYQYLIQATENGTSARELIESYSPSGSSYHKAIQELKNRFAKDEMLIENYVRELLSLILSQSQCKVMELRELLDKLSTHLHALETLGVTSDKCAAMLYPIVESAIPEELLRIWQRNNIPTNTYSEQLTALLDFIRKEVENEERIKLARSGFAEPSTSHTKVPTANCIIAGDVNRRTNQVEKENKVEKCCIWCEKTTHCSSECYKTSNMTLEERKEHIKKKNGCFICLKLGHNAKKCRNFPKCLKCSKRHTIVMCPNLEEKTTVPQKNPEVLLSHNSTTLLPTLLVKLGNLCNNNTITVRALFDSGSQRSYVKRDVATKLGLMPIGKESLGHNLFGGLQTAIESHDVYQFQVTSIDNAHSFLITALNKDRICGKLPCAKGDILSKKLKELNIVLYDCMNDSRDNEADIGILIGSDFLGPLMSGCSVDLGSNLVCLKTKLGWIVQGPVVGDYYNVNTTNFVTDLFCSNDFDLTDFWNLETLGIKEPAEYKNKEKFDAEVITNFNEKIKVNEENRYEVHLPWKLDYPQLQANYDLARKRLESVTKKLINTGKLRDYDNVFKEWLSMNIIEIAPDQDSKTTGHFLAHHAVIKEESLTTKIRPVFDGSAKDRNGISINDCLEKGENLLELIPKLLIDFRSRAIGIISDIKKAFLMISLNEVDREYLKFLWWNNTETRDHIVTYRHRRVVFGIKSSPFLLAATIIYHLDRNCSEEFKEIAQKLKKSFYVDNCVTSVNTPEEMQEFIDTSKVLMMSGGFDLRGWVSSPVHIDKTEVSSVLSVLLHIKSDELACNMQATEENIKSKITKRYLLSITQRFFDPIGFIAPTTIIPRLIMRKCWNKQIHWDEEIPQDLRDEFIRWFKYVSLLKECRVSRRLSDFILRDCEDVSIHVFCDACKYAYACCVFLRTVKQGKACVRLILAKNRIAPAKEISLPRLELMAALIGIRLWAQIKESDFLKDCKDYRLYCWSDSSVTLSWIKGTDQWRPFVHNRVQEILMHSNRDDWRHLPGQFNPADLPSRGCSAKTLLESEWWNGPQWLLNPISDWPKSVVNVSNEEDRTLVESERKKLCQINIEMTTENFTSRLTYFSKYNKIIRMIGWIFRFCQNAKGDMKRSGELDGGEIEHAEMKLLKMIQDERFKDDEGKDFDPHTFRDSDGILRIKTRLTLSEEGDNFKYPIKLPGSHIIIEQLVYEAHLQMKHAGTQTLISHLRERFWIVGIRKLSRKMVKACVRCKRHSAKCGQMPFAPLPTNRVKLGKAFEVTGVDLAGPLFLRSGEKCWIVLFTCAVYRAVHLELTSSLSTEMFLMALRRFISRRGRVSVIYSDNGTNFVGTSNLLKNIDWTDVVARTSIQRIKWQFIPPAAPWWGGWWERIVRVVKDLLRRSLGNACLDFIELETLLCDCESVINSRPLTYVADTTENLLPLTPLLFLQPLPNNETTDLDIIDSRGLNIRLKYLQKLREDFRMRFRSEYLSLLVEKGKGIKANPIREGDIVLIEVDKKRIHWPLGLVLEVFSGVDGLARVARIKTSTGQKIRPIQKLYPLELRSDEVGTNEQIIHKTMPTQNLTRSGRVVKIPQRFL